MSVLLSRSLQSILKYIKDIQNIMSLHRNEIKFRLQQRNMAAKNDSAVPADLSAVCTNRELESKAFFQKISQDTACSIVLPEASTDTLQPCKTSSAQLPSLQTKQLFTVFTSKFQNVLNTINEWFTSSKAANKTFRVDMPAESSLAYVENLPSDSEFDALHTSSRVFESRADTSDYTIRTSCNEAGMQTSLNPYMVQTSTGVATDLQTKITLETAEDAHQKTEAMLPQKRYRVSDSTGTYNVLAAPQRDADTYIVNNVHAESYLVSPLHTNLQSTLIDFDNSCGSCTKKNKINAEMQVIPEELEM